MKKEAEEGDATVAASATDADDDVEAQGEDIEKWGMYEEEYSGW